jgi:D-alanyl-D-alanine carboxypeptidase
LDRVRDPMTPTEFLGYVQGEPMEFAPGAKWNYNNSGYYLLGMLIEKLTGSSFRDELQKRILKPLGMTATDMNDPSLIVKHRARGYNPNPKRGPENADFVDMGWPYAAGAIISNVRDLAKWDAALYTDSPVKQSLLKQGWTPVKLNDGSDFGYGFGWFLDKINGISTVHHGGDIPGFNSDVLRIPSKKLTIIALCNSDPGVAVMATKAVAGIVDPALLVEVKAISDTDPKTTEAHRKLLLAAADGTIKKELFNEEMQAQIFPDRIKGAQGFLTSLGQLGSFELIKVEEKDGNKIRVYRAKYTSQDVNVIVATDKNGKIAGFALAPG